MPAERLARARRPGQPTARKLVQLGFLALFLYPFVLIVFKRLTFKPAPTLTSWLLPWDPLLLLGQLAHRNLGMLVVGAPLLVLAGTLILGRFFCGWICPMGTVLDLVRPLARWQKRKGSLPGGRGPFPAGSNSPARYYLLLAVLAGGVISVQFVGVLDPLVILHRGATVLTSTVLIQQRPASQIYLSVSLVFLALLALELWQPRFWCRHLCPLGALISVFSRFSLLNRRVSESCNGCAECRRSCTMRAIPKEGHDTSYGDCHMCLACESACPKGAITFGFGKLAGRKWQPEGRVKDASGRTRRQGRYLPARENRKGAFLSRRGFVSALAAGAAGLAVPSALHLSEQGAVIRPPGALDEDEFVRTCIICQECVRVCPTGGLKPAFLEAGLAGMGTPRLVTRQGACALNPSCNDLCAAVCPTGAIRAIAPDDLKLGLARVDRSLCLAWDQGAKCLVCVEACLVGAAQAYHGRVTVDPGKCTGCGRCEQACPIADAAIHVYPV